jgi:butyrate kinase
VQFKAGSIDASMDRPLSKIAHYVSFADPIGITDGEAEVLSLAFGQLKMIQRLEQDDFSWNHNLVRA